MTKGNHWEVIPSKRDLLDRDIDTFIFEQCNSLCSTPLSEGGPRKTVKTKTKSSTEQRVDGKSSRNTGLCSKAPTKSALPNGAKLNGQTSQKSRLNSQDTPNGSREISKQNCYSLQTSVTPFTGERCIQQHNNECSLNDERFVHSFDDEDPIPPSAKTTGTTLPVSHSTPLLGVTLPQPLSVSPLYTSISTKDGNSDDVTFGRSSTNNCVYQGHIGDVFSVNTSTLPYIPSLSSSFTPIRNKITPQERKTNHEISDSRVWFEVEESDQSPFINPTHPLVAHGTLSFVNGGAAVRQRMVAMTTPNIVTYVASPTPTMMISDLCTPTSSGLTATRMTHRFIT